MVVIRASQKKWAQRAHFVQLVKCGVGRIAPETASDRRNLRGGLGGNGPRRRGAAGRREARTQGPDTREYRGDRRTQHRGDPALHRRHRACFAKSSYVSATSETPATTRTAP